MPLVYKELIKKLKNGNEVIDMTNTYDQYTDYRQAQYKSYLWKLLIFSFVVFFIAMFLLEFFSSTPQTEQSYFDQDGYERWLAQQETDKYGNAIMAQK